MICIKVTDDIDSSILIEAKEMVEFHLFKLNPWTAEQSDQINKLVVPFF